MRGAAPDLAPAEAEALAQLAEGSPGEALRLRAAGGLSLYNDVLAFVADPGAPKKQKPILDVALSKNPAAPGLEVVTRLLPLALSRLARASYRPDDLLAAEKQAAAQLSAGDAAARIWAEAASETRDRLEAATGVNLDPGRTILDTALYLEQAARRARSA